MPSEGNGSSWTLNFLADSLFSQLVQVCVSLVGKILFLFFQVLENFSDAPMTPKQILHVIQTKGLKEMRSDSHTHTNTHTII